MFKQITTATKTIVYYFSLNSKETNGSASRTPFTCHYRTAFYEIFPVIKLRRNVYTENYCIHLETYTIKSTCSQHIALIFLKMLRNVITVTCFSLSLPQGILWIVCHVEIKSNIIIYQIQDNLLSKCLQVHTLLSIVADILKNVLKMSLP